MKITNLLLTLAATGGLFIASCGSQDQAKEGEANAEGNEETVLVIDPAASTVNWSGNMVGMYAHNGTVALEKASVSMKEDVISGGSFMVNLSQIIPLDENYDPSKGQGKKELVGHLSSADFFDIANYKIASFQISEVAEDGSSAQGKMMIKGVSKIETVENITFADGTISGTLTFDRTDYGVSFVNPAKDMVLSDDIKLEITLKVAE